MRLRIHKLEQNVVHMTDMSMWTIQYILEIQTNIYYELEYKLLELLELY